MGYLRRHLYSEQSLHGGPVMQFVGGHRRAFDQPSAFDPKPPFKIQECWPSELDDVFIDDFASIIQVP